MRKTAGGAGFDARAVLEELAQPRFCGSAGWQATHARVRRLFEEAGCTVDARPFEASLVPGRFAFPAAGFSLFAASAFAILALLDERRVLALAVLATGALLVTLIARGAAAATDRWSVQRLRMINLFAFRPDAHPRWLFVAHLDSKSQFVPLMLRAAAAGGAVLIWGALLLLALLGGPPSREPWLLGTLAVLAMTCGVPLLLSGSGNGSPGALDNASGVATLIGLAAAERNANDIAFLITDGEELGLAGSRAIGTALPPVEGVINVDGIDDGGSFFVLERFGLRRQGRAPHIAHALLAAAQAAGMPARRRDVPLGLILDHMSFTHAGFPALTLMRGTLRSMARVHRPADDLTHLRGTGVDAAVELLRGALVVLRAGIGRPYGARVYGLAPPPPTD